MCEGGFVVNHAEEIGGAPEIFFKAGVLKNLGPKAVVSGIADGFQEGAENGAGNGVARGTIGVNLDLHGVGSGGCR